MCGARVLSYERRKQKGGFEMSTTNMNSNSESNTSHVLPAVMEGGVGLVSDDESSQVNGPRRILQSALAALSEGRASEVVEQFDEHFIFNDHALTLEFTDKLRLTEFFEKARELFPDTTLEIVSLFESGDHAIAEWKLAATQTVSYGSIGYQFRVSLPGASIVRVENGKIVRWSDYYDQNSSRRINLAAFFTEWIEY
jgi:ketosteroid isomerase-like protein